MVNPNEVSTRELRLELFGGPRLYRGESIVRLSPQEALLLGLLGAVGEEGMERDDLLDLFWNSGTRGKLRLRLSQILHMVRKKSGSSELVCQLGSRLILPASEVSTDMMSLRESLHRMDFAGAVRIVNRGFFAAVVDYDTHGLVGFVERVKADAQGGVRTALHQAVQRAEAGTDFPSLSILASLQLQMDPSDESSLRLLVRSLGAQGRVAEARAEYLSFCHEQTRSSPSWTPSAASQDLFASLGRVSSDSSWVRRHLRHVGSLCLPMLGREDQRAVLQGILNGNDNPRPRLVAITADPGIGRSRILHETLREVELAGGIVLFAKCEGGPQSRSLHPISEALATSKIDDLLNRMVGPAPRIIRETVLARPPTGRGTPAEPAKPLYSLSSICESLMQLFLLMSQQDPLVIALDDAHLADPDTLHLISYMIRRGLPPHVTLILAVDDSDPAAPHILGIGEPYTHLVDSYVLPLEPLQEDSLERLTLHMLGVGCPGELISAVAALSGGSPKRATELCERLRSSHPFAEDRHLEALAALVARLSASLPPLAASVLHILAVAKASLPLRCLVDILDSPERAIRNSVDGLPLAWVRVGSLEYSLVHPLVASALYSSLPERDRRRLHIAIATSLEALEDFGRSNQIAAHLVRGSENEKAVDWIELALERGGAGFDPAPSVALAEEVLLLGAPPEGRMRLYALLGRHWLRMGEAAKSRDHSERALSVGRAFDIRPDLVRAAEVARLEALILEKEPAIADVLPEIHRLTDQLTEEANWILLARVLHVALRSVDSGGLPDLEQDILRHISQIIGHETDRLQREHLPLALVFCSQLRKGRNSHGQRVLSTALGILRQEGDEAGLAKALQVEFLEKYHCGSLNSPEGIRARQDCLAVAEGLQDSLLFCRHHLNTAVWYLDTFDLEGAAKAISLAQDYTSHFCPPQLSRELLFNRAELLLLEGKAHEALKLFLEGLGNSPTRDTDAGSLLFAAGAACCYSRMRRHSEAREFLPPVSYLSSSWSVDLSLLLRAHGELATDEVARSSFLVHCEKAVEQLRRTSVIWQLKALLQMCETRKRFGLAPLGEEVSEALKLCREKGLPYIAGRLQPYARS